MKKMKKLAALVLALAMSFSLMAVTAAAYGAEGHVHDETCAADTIQPRLPVPVCGRCGIGMVMIFHSGGSGGQKHHAIYECPTCGETMTVEW